MRTYIAILIILGLLSVTYGQGQSNTKGNSNNAPRNDRSNQGSANNQGNSRSEQGELSFSESSTNPSQNRPGGTRLPVEEVEVTTPTGEGELNIEITTEAVPEGETLTIEVEVTQPTAEGETEKVVVNVEITGSGEGETVKIEAEVPRVAAEGETVIEVEAAQPTVVVETENVAVEVEVAAPAEKPNEEATPTTEIAIFLEEGQIAEVVVTSNEPEVEIKVEGQENEHTQAEVANTEFTGEEGTSGETATEVYIPKSGSGESGGEVVVVAEFSGSGGAGPETEIEVINLSGQGGEASSSGEVVTVFEGSGGSGSGISEESVEVTVWEGSGGSGTEISEESVEITVFEGSGGSGTESSSEESAEVVEFSGQGGEGGLSTGVTVTTEGSGGSGTTEVSVEVAEFSGEGEGGSSEGGVTITEGSSATEGSTEGGALSQDILVSQGAEAGETNLIVQGTTGSAGGPEIVEAGKECKTEGTEADVNVEVGKGGQEEQGQEQNCDYDVDIDVDVEIDVDCAKSSNCSHSLCTKNLDVHFVLSGIVEVEIIKDGKVMTVSRPVRIAH